MEKHILTQEDLDQWPQLVEQGFKVGDEIEYDQLPSKEGDSQSSADSDGGDTKEGHDPIGGGDPIKG